MDPLNTRAPHECSCILFDFDGTLADTLEGIVSTAKTVLTEWGLSPLELGDIKRIVGPPFPYAFMDVYGFSYDDAIEITKRYRELYISLGLRAWPAFEGIPELLERLQAAGKRLALVSSKRESVVLQGLNDNQITHYFELICGQRDYQESSKSAAIGRVMKELCVEAQDCVMVGDRRDDCICASENGLPTIGVTYGNTGSVKELRGAGAAWIATSVSELQELLLTT